LPVGCRYWMAKSLLFRLGTSRSTPSKSIRSMVSFNETRLKNLKILNKIEKTNFWIQW
jgi:hypothetical protein